MGVPVPRVISRNRSMIRIVIEPGAKTQLYNLNIRKERTDLLEWDTNHVNIDKNTKIHADIVKKANEHDE